MSTPDFRNYAYLLDFSQKNLANFLVKKLEKIYKKDNVCFIENVGIIALNPSANPKSTLIAHLDTINTHRLKTLENYNISENLVNNNGFLEFSEKTKHDNYYSCVGFDDRAGVATCLEIINQSETKAALPNIIFCFDEEIGGTVPEFINHEKSKPFFKNLKTNVLIEIDTPNVSTETFREFGFAYNFYNENLKTICENLGYIEHSGPAITDINDFNNILSIPAISLSASYEKEHSVHERLSLSAWSDNAQRLQQLMKITENKEFKNEKRDIYHSDYYDENIYLSLFDEMESLLYSYEIDEQMNDEIMNFIYEKFMENNLL